MFVESCESFVKRASDEGLTPLVATLLADMETPLSAYWKLAHDDPHSFLFESVTGGEALARYSMIGCRPKHIVSGHGRILTTDGLDRKLAPDEDLLTEAVKLIPPLGPEEAVGLPRLCGGAVGWIAYDYVRAIERLPLDTEDDLGLPDISFMILDQAVVFDHARNVIQVIVLAPPTQAGYVQARGRIEELVHRLKGPLPNLPESPGTTPVFHSNMAQEVYEAGVRKCVDYIISGDAFQIVPSQRQEAECTAHPVLIYRALRSLNPSPYMFLLRMDGTEVVGASPEILVALHGKTALVRPIAGTRPRGTSPEEDHELAADLLKDEKERAEHIMLVDLGRNDLGRVCEFGSVKVKDLMEIERYSHVMHIVSQVEGRLKPGVTQVDLIRATFPAGTLTGAPKVRAMEIIEELEPTRRGLYGGAVGFISSTGDMDLAIAIRSALISNGKCYVQAGAGVVFDSVPSKEHHECLNKAMAVVRAVVQAHEGLPG
mgnify:CR=1 FL=1